MAFDNIHDTLAQIARQHAETALQTYRTTQDPKDNIQYQAAMRYAQYAEAYASQDCDAKPDDPFDYDPQYASPQLYAKACAHFRTGWTPNDFAIFHQTAATVTWRFALGCIVHGPDADPALSPDEIADAIAWSLHALSDTALMRVAQATMGLHHASTQPVQDPATPNTSAVTILVSKHICSALTYGGGMALCTLWGTAMPWVMVLTGAVLSGAVSGTALRPESWSRAMASVIGWTATALGAYGLLSCLIPLVATSGMVMAISISATALSAVGFFTLMHAQGLAPKAPAQHARL